MANDTSTATPIEESSCVLVRKPVLEPWPGPWEMWAKGFCAKNQWRVVHVLGDYDDCLAECALTFVECSRRYGKTVVSPQQMMYLYKLSVVCWFNVLSVRDQSCRRVREAIKEEEPSVKGDAEAMAKLSEASSELKDVINIFFSAPKEIFDVIRADVASNTPIHFFNAVLDYCKIPRTKTQPLINELISILT